MRMSPDTRARGWKAYVTGIWPRADNTHRGEPVLVPPHSSAEWLSARRITSTCCSALLKQPAQTIGPSVFDVTRWRPLAKAAVAEDEAILADDCIPDGPSLLVSFGDRAFGVPPPGRSAGAADRCPSAVSGDAERLSWQASISPHHRPVPFPLAQISVRSDIPLVACGLNRAVRSFQGRFAPLARLRPAPVARPGRSDAGRCPLRRNPTSLRCRS